MFQEQVERLAKVRKPGNLKLQTANRKPQLNLMLKVSIIGILTAAEPEVNNCFSIYTHSDLSRIGND